VCVELDTQLGKSLRMILMTQSDFNPDIPTTVETGVNSGWKRELQFFGSIPDCVQ
jgi:hypothetical protein